MFGVGCWMHGHPIITGRMAGGRLPLLLMLLEMAQGHVVGTAVSLPPSHPQRPPSHMELMKPHFEEMEHLETNTSISS